MLDDIGVTDRARAHADSKSVSRLVAKTCVGVTGWPGTTASTARRSPSAGRVRFPIHVLLQPALGTVGRCRIRSSRRSPRGLALQPGSFFTPLLDPQESRYAFFDRVCSAVAEISAPPGPCTVPIWMSCGAIEENLANNDRMATALKDQGYPLVFELVPGRPHHDGLARRLDDWLGSPAFAAVLSPALPSRVGRWKMPP